MHTQNITASDNCQEAKRIPGIQHIDRLNKRKAYAQMIADLYDESVFFQYGGKIRACAEQLITYEYEGDQHEIAYTMFCGCRLCPVCAHRRSLKAYSQISRVMEYLDDQRRQSDKLPYEYLMVTLTIENCEGDALPEAIDRLYDGYVRLNHLSRWRSAIKGAWRTLEVTYNQDAQTFHPHLHVLCAVNASYFTSKAYISQDELIQLWMKVCRLPYEPSVRISRVKSSGGLNEVTKYVTKHSSIDLPSIYEAIDVIEYLHAGLHGRKLYCAYGVIRAAQRALHLSDEDGDLLDLNDDDGELAASIRKDLAYTIRAMIWTDDAGYIPLTGSIHDICRSLNVLEQHQYARITKEDFFLKHDHA